MRTCSLEVTRDDPVHLCTYTSEHAYVNARVYMYVYVCILYTYVNSGLEVLMIEYEQHQLIRNVWISFAL